MKSLGEWKASQITAYQGLAVHAAHVDEPWIALNAQIAAARIALQFAVVRSSTDEDTPEDVMFILNSVWSEVHDAIENLDGEDSVSLRAAVEAVYQVMKLKLESHTWSYLTELLTPASHFPDLEISDQSLTGHFAWKEMGAGSLEVLISRKLFDATKLYKEFFMLIDESRAAAFSALYQADTLTFEAWVLRQTSNMGDETRVFAGIQLALANAYLKQLRGIPLDLDSYESLVRGSFARAAGLEDASDLGRAFPTLVY